MAPFGTTYHRDNTVTIWDCYSQQWIRTGEPSDHLLASLGSEERDRVVLHCAGVHLTTKFRRVGDDRCDQGGCPDQRCAGGVSWAEARRCGGRISVRTVWSNAGRWCAGAPTDAEASDIIAAC